MAYDLSADDKITRLELEINEQGLKISELETKLKTSEANLTIPDVSESFNVGTYTIIDENTKMYSHWADGLKMVIEKNGISIKLDENEIQDIVKSLPRTIGGKY